MQLDDREAILRLTAQNPFERFPNGRPRVPDDLLERVRKVTLEEAWGVLRRNGYHHQFVGDWQNVHPNQHLVGRAVTCAFVSLRPDMNEAVSTWGQERNCIGGQNSWVIDTLVENDVIVVDLFGKVRDGTFAGDNLGNSIAAKTKTGMIIHGGVRDLAHLAEIPNFSMFVRGIDPSAIANVTLASLNAPIRIDQATILPGDVVLGTPGGIIFIPPHLVEAVITRSEEVRLRDEFGHQRLREGRYTPGQIDRGDWDPEILADFDAWKAARGH